MRQKLGAAEKYGIDPDFYLTLNDKQRLKIAGRYSEGMRGERLIQQLDVEKRVVEMAEKVGVSVEFWTSLNKTLRNRIRVRYNRGVRGEELLEGIPQ